MKKNLIIIQDYHHNILATYNALKTHYNVSIVGDYYYKPNKEIKIIKWKTIKLNKIYWGNPFKIIKPVIKADRIIIKDIQPKSLIAIMICKLLRKKFVLSLQKITVKRFNLLKYLVDKDTPIILSVIESYPYLQDYFKTVNYIPFAVRMNKKKEHKNRKTTKLLCVSKRQKRKHLEWLIRAYYELSLKYKLSLTIVGKNLIDFEDDQLKVKIKSNLTRTEVNKEYAKANIFVLPAHNEPANYSILEAMSHGLICICSDTNGTRGYLNSESAIFKSNDYNNFKNKLEFYIISKHMYNFISKKNWTLALNNHNPTLIAKEIKEVIECQHI